MKTLILASALIALSAPSLALAQCQNCPAAERERADHLETLRSDYQAKAQEFRRAHSAYVNWRLEAHQAFHERMAERQKNQVKAFGSLAVRVNGSERGLDQIARATRGGDSAKIMLTPEGRAIAGIDSAEREERALEEIAASLRAAFPSHGLQTRLFGGGDRDAWKPTQWGGAILGVSFERFPIETPRPVAAARVSETLGPKGEELWARLEAAAMRLQASDAAFRSAAGSPATPRDFLSVPTAAPPKVFLSEFLRMETLEFGGDLDSL